MSYAEICTTVMYVTGNAVRLDEDTDDGSDCWVPRSLLSEESENKIQAIEGHSVPVEGVNLEVKEWKAMELGLI